MKRLCLFLFILTTLGPSMSEAGFDDLLKDVIVQTAGSQAIGTDDYSFAPGDVVIQKDDYAVIYSGHELIGGNKTLLLTLNQASGSALLKYPNPNVIQVKDFRLQIVAFGNDGLSVRVLQKG